MSGNIRMALLNYLCLSQPVRSWSENLQSIRKQSYVQHQIQNVAVKLRLYIQNAQ